MGRIAQALKKAEEEREGRLTHAQPSADDSSGLDVRTHSTEAPPSRTAVEVAATSRSTETWTPAAKHRPNEGLSDSIIAHSEPNSIIAEQYRGLRTRLMSQNPANENRIIAITSSTPKDGKSVSTVNTAVTMAEIRHQKVLVVDGDFRRASLATMLNLPKSPGLANVLQGNATFEEALYQTQIPNLYCMPAGTTSGRGAAELLSEEGAGPIFQRFQREFDYTIIDTPPATTVTDVGIIGKWCHGVIMVVRLNKTPEPVAQRAVRMLQVNNVAILGVLMVGDEARAPGYGYSRYYNYYRYYYTDSNKGKPTKPSRR